MADNGMKGRVKDLLAVPQAGEAPPPPFEVPPHARAQFEALQVLTLAQKTADDQVASARQEAEQICGQARETAGQIVRDAQAHAEGLQRETEHVRSEAQATAQQIAQDAQAHADQARREAEAIMSEARMRSDEFVKEAQTKADDLQHLAQQRYEDVVGGLAAKREALQQQIEALERFDREYRARLQAFLQGQLRALWVDEPRVDPEELERPVPAPAPADGFGPAQQAEAYQAEAYQAEAYQNWDEADRLRSEVDQPA